MDNEITFYNFYSQVRSFVGKLRKDPIGAQPGETLKKVGLTKDKLIKLLMKKGIISRDESIKDKTDGIQGEAKYVVKYTIKLSDAKKFERTVKKMFIQYCEKNVPMKEEVKINKVLQEEDGGAAPAGGGGADGGSAGGSGDVAGATNAESSGQYVTVTFPLQRRAIYDVKPENKKKKTITISEQQFNIIKEVICGKEKPKKKKKVMVNEKQFKLLKEVFAQKNGGDAVLDEETTTFGVGDYTYDKPISDGHQNKFYKDTLKRKDGKGGSTSIPKKRVGEDG